MLKEAIVAHFNILSRYLHGEIIKLSVAFPSQYKIDTSRGSIFIEYNH
jgi:hypothetical protein